MAKKGTDLFLYLTMGFIGGMTLDYLGYAYNAVPGQDNVITSDPQLTEADWYQLLGTTAITLAGFLFHSDGLAMAGFGAQQGAMYTKIYSTMAKLPRYIITDVVGGSAQLTPVGTTPAQASKLKTGQTVKGKFGEEVYI